MPPGILKLAGGEGLEFCVTVAVPPVVTLLNVRSTPGIGVTVTLFPGGTVLSDVFIANVTDIVQSAVTGVVVYVFADSVPAHVPSTIAV